MEVKGKMLSIKNLNKYYQSENGDRYHALKGINLEISNKGFVVILGKSGSGKSTLLNILGGLDNYDSGELIINGKSTKDLKPHEWDSFRNTYVGIVFQEFYIIEEYTVGKNIALALELQGYPKEQIEKRVMEILKQVDLAGYANRKPNEISGGQKQRIAIARALVKDPQIILADEPTGNLDSVTGRLVLQTLKKLSKEKLVIMVTHDQQFAKLYGDRIIEIKDGVVINDELNDHEQIDQIIELDDQTIIKVSKEEKLSQETIEYISQFIEHQEKDVYLLCTQRDDFVTPIEQPLNEGYHEEEINEPLKNESLNLKKSSLPFKHALKLAFSSLLTKKLHLMLITLLFIISLAFVGIASTISLYDVSIASTLTFKNANIKYLPIQKHEYKCYKEVMAVYCDDRPIIVKDEDFVKLKNDFPKLQFAKIQDVNISLPIDASRVEELNQYGYFSDSFNRVTLLDQNEEMFPLRVGNYPVNEDEVLISDYMARVIVEYEVFEDANNFEDIIGLIIPHSINYKIVGIVKTDYEKFDYLINKTNSQNFEKVNFDQLTSIYYRQIYMSNETYERSLLKYQNRTSYRTGWGAVGTDITIIPTHQLYEDRLIGDSHLPRENNEIVLPASKFMSIYDVPTYMFSNIEEEYERLINLIGDEIQLSFKNQFYRFTLIREYKLVGLYNDITMEPLRNNSSSEVIGTKEEIGMIKREIVDSDLMGLVLLGDNHKGDLQFIRALDDLGYKHQNEYSSLLYEVAETTKGIQRIFYISGIVLAVFTSFLIFSFISASIINKQKDIGTLRAIGARGKDVSKIFIIEGFIIAIIASLLASLAMVLGIKLINGYISNGLDTALVLLYSNWLNFLIVFILSSIVILISTFIPVKRITLMKPIQAIKKVN